MRLIIGREKIRRAAIISLPLVFALTAAVSIALLVRPADAPKGDDPPKKDSVANEGAGEGEKNDLPVISPIETPSDSASLDLEFRSKGNGTCAVVGMGECTDRAVIIPTRSPDGDAVVEISVGAFADRDGIVEISIPDGVVSIGAGAFSNCRSLERIVVGDANPLFHSEDGVLFNKAMSTLVCYPSGKKDKVYVLPKSVLRIGEGAFSICPSLLELKFLGTPLQWEAVYVAAGNGGLDRVSIVCASADK